MSTSFMLKGFLDDKFPPVLKKLVEIVLKPFMVTALQYNVIINIKLECSQMWFLLLGSQLKTYVIVLLILRR